MNLSIVQELLVPIDEAGLKQVKLIEIQLTGEDPILAGWRFLGVIQHTTEGNVFRTIPGEKIPEEFRYVSPKCEHCNTVRLRKDTYILKDINGEFNYRMIGSSCLQDFLGHDPAATIHYFEYLASIVQMIESVEGESKSSYRGTGLRDDYVINLPVYLRHVAAIIRSYGWVSKSKAFNDPLLEPTADLASYNMFPPAVRNRPLAIVEDQDTELANKALEWARTVLKDKEDANDYEMNLRVAVSNEAIDHRLTGIAASLIMKYNIEMNKQETAKTSTSMYLGSVDDLVQTEIKVVRASGYESIYGYGTCYNMEDSHGNIMVWFTSGNAVLHLGDLVTIKGRIKALEEYQGVKQTIVTRCRIIKGVAK